MNSTESSTVPTGDPRPPVTFEQNMAALNDLGAIIDKRLAEIVALKAIIRRYRAAMEEVCNELADDFDITDSGGPNKAMSLSNTLKEAIYGPGGF